MWFFKKRKAFSHYQWNSLVPILLADFFFFWWLMCSICARADKHYESKRFHMLKIIKSPIWGWIAVTYLASGNNDRKLGRNDWLWIQFATAKKTGILSFAGFLYCRPEILSPGLYLCLMKAGIVECVWNSISPYIFHGSVLNFLKKSII